MKARVSTTNQRATAGDRKVAFKSVLDNPFKVNWPYVPQNVQQTALDSLVTILHGVGPYHLERRLAAGARKRARHNEERKQRAAKRRKVGEEGEAISVDKNDIGPTPQDASEPGNLKMEIIAGPDKELSPAPPIVHHLLVGLNEVTRRLEFQAQSRRLRTSISASTSDSVQISPTDSQPEPGRAPLAYVFVCRADIDPPLLIAHLPELVASCNAPSPSVKSPPVHLITLPKQAEHTLAETVGLRRVSVLALDSAAPSLVTLSTLLVDIQPPSASWLTGPAPHIPTHIKQLRTTVPRDMRAAKQARTEGRRAAKEKNKLHVGIKNTRRGKKTIKNSSVEAMTKVKTKAKPPRKHIRIVSSMSGSAQNPQPK